MILILVVYGFYHKVDPIFRVISINIIIVFGLRGMYYLMLCKKNIFMPFVIQLLNLSLHRWRLTFVVFIVIIYSARFILDIIVDIFLLDLIFIMLIDAVRYLSLMPTLCIWWFAWIISFLSLEFAILFFLFTRCPTSSLSIFVIGPFRHHGPIAGNKMLRNTATTIAWVVCVRIIVTSYGILDVGTCRQCDAKDV